MVIIGARPPAADGADEEPFERIPCDDLPPDAGDFDEGLVVVGTGGDNRPLPPEIEAQIKKSMRKHRRAGTIGAMPDEDED